MNIISVWVCFTGETELKWLSLLKKGFKHCCILIEYETHWFVLDPLSTYTEVEVISKIQSGNLPLFLSSQNYFVLKAPLNREGIKPHTIGIYSCVSFVKKILGIKSWRVQTPWQLARYLFAHQTKGENMGKIISPLKAPKMKGPSEADINKEEEERRKKASATQGLLSQTVKTSLQGVLSDTNDFVPQRKNLLGE